MTTVIYMSQKGLMQAGGVFRCLSGLSCFNSLGNQPNQRFFESHKIPTSISDFQNYCLIVCIIIYNLYYNMNIVNSIHVTL